MINLKEMTIYIPISDDNKMEYKFENLSVVCINYTTIKN